MDASSSSSTTKAVSVDAKVRKKKGTSASTSRSSAKKISRLSKTHDHAHIHILSSTSPSPSPSSAAGVNSSSAALHQQFHKDTASNSSTTGSNGRKSLRPLRKKAGGQPPPPPPPPPHPRNSMKNSPKSPEDETEELLSTSTVAPVISEEIPCFRNTQKGEETKAQSTHHPTAAPTEESQPDSENQRSTEPEENTSHSSSCVVEQYDARRGDEQSINPAEANTRIDIGGKQLGNQETQTSSENEQSLKPDIHVAGRENKQPVNTEETREERQLASRGSRNSSNSSIDDRDEIHTIGQVATCKPSVADNLVGNVNPSPSSSGSETHVRNSQKEESSSATSADLSSRIDTNERTESVDDDDDDDDGGGGADTYDQYQQQSQQDKQDLPRKTEPGRASRLFAPKSWAEKFRSTRRRLKQNFLVTLGATESSRDSSFENTQLRFRRVQDSLEKLRSGVIHYLQKLCQSTDATYSLASTLNFLASSDVEHGVVSEHPHAVQDYAPVPVQLSARALLTIQYEVKQLAYKCVEQHVTEKILQPIGALMNQLSGIKHLLEKRNRYQTDVDAYKRKLAQSESAKQRSEAEIQRQKEKLQAAEEAFEKVTNAVLKCLNEMECARALLVQDTLNALVASQSHFHSLMNDTAVTLLPYFTDVATPTVELAYLTSAKAANVAATALPDPNRRIEVDKKLVFEPLRALLQQLQEGKPISADGTPSETFAKSLESGKTYSETHEDVTTKAGLNRLKKQDKTVPGRYHVNDTGTKSAQHPTRMSGTGFGRLHSQLEPDLEARKPHDSRASYTGVQSAIRSLKRQSTLALDVVAAYDVERQVTPADRTSTESRRRVA